MATEYSKDVLSKRNTRTSPVYSREEKYSASGFPYSEKKSFEDSETSLTMSESSTSDCLDSSPSPWSRITLLRSKSFSSKVRSTAASKSARNYLFRHSPKPEEPITLTSAATTTVATSDPPTKPVSFDFNVDDIFHRDFNMCTPQMLHYLRHLRAEVSPIVCVEETEDSLELELHNFFMVTTASMISGDPIVHIQ